MAAFTLGALTTVPVSTRPDLVAPSDWPVLVDAQVAASAAIIVGSGIRRSKLILPGAVLAGLPGVEVVDGLAKPIEV
ncbi:hypothetical protein ACEXOS_003740 [Herbiconiux sp. P16]|uniref:hypothetical protein n=1 Tax=Herbiconiux wuyangfengii TaxID=3342794 RepID=UPI0035BA9043